VPSYSIPLGALIPEKVNGFIVSDKSISVSNLINGATRLQPVVLLTGQAAGTLAALTVKENKEVREISIRKVQQSLLNQKAYISPLFDVKPTDVDFETIQKIVATGILKTKGESYKWANRTWFYPDATITIQEFTEGLHQFNHKSKIIKKQNVLTEQQAAKLIRKAGGTFNNKSKFSNGVITKRELAKLIQESLNPFAKEIDFAGNLK
jgi:hypothetical protein